MSWVLLLTLTLAACGQTSAHTPYASPSASELGSTLTTANSPIDVNADGLHIQSNPLACASSGQPVTEFVSRWLVLATTNLTYDAGEVQQMRGYVNALLGSSPAGAPPQPSTLKWVQGAQTVPQIGPYQGVPRFYTKTYCDADLQVTNTSTNTIQILQAGLRLQAAPQPNHGLYRLIDVCSLVSQDECQQNQGASDLCSAYDVQIQLANGDTGTQFLGTPVGFDPAHNPCPPLLLAPAATDDLNLNFGSTEALSYAGVIELKLETASGQQTLVLTQVPDTLAFASPSQFTCYQLQGTTFTTEAQGAAALVGYTSDTQTRLNHACL